MTSSNSLSRREFLLSVLTLGAGVAATGGVAWGSQQAHTAEQLAQELTALKQASLGVSPSVVTPNALLGEKDAQIARLASELAAAQQQIQQLQALLSESQNAAYQAQTDLQTLTQQTGELENRNTYLQGLVDLFEKLEGIGIDDVFSLALVTLSTTWSTLASFVPRFEVGKGVVIPALDGFDNSLPGWQVNLTRVKDLLAVGESLLERVRQTAQQVAQKAEQISEPFTDFVKVVLSKLPFDSGKKIEETLNNFKELVLHLPNLFTDARVLVLAPLAQFTGETAESWLTTLTRPVREHLLAPVQEFMSAWGQANQTLAEQVLTPTQTALQARADVRAQIQAHKAQQTG
jgi:AcrR family transcriptional regulator